MSNPVYRVTDEQTHSLLTEMTGLQHRFLQEGLHPDDVIRTIRELRLRPQPFNVLAYRPGRWDDAWATEDGFVVRQGNDFWRYYDDGRSLNFSIESIPDYRQYYRHHFGVLIMRRGQVDLHQFTHSIILYQGACDIAKAHPRGALITTHVVDSGGRRRTEVNLAHWNDRQPFVNSRVTVTKLLANLSPLHHVFAVEAGVLWHKRDGGWEYNREFVLCTPQGNHQLFKGVGYNFLPHPRGVIVVNEQQEILLCTPEFSVPLYNGEWQAIPCSSGGQELWGLAHPDGIILRHGKQLLLYTGNHRHVLFEGQSFGDACVDDVGRVLLRTSNNKIWLCQVGQKPLLVSDVPHRFEFGPHVQGAFMVENDRIYVCTPKENGK